MTTSERLSALLTIAAIIGGAITMVA